MPPSFNGFLSEPRFDPRTLPIYGHGGYTHRNLRRCSTPSFRAPTYISFWLVESLRGRSVDLPAPFPSNFLGLLLAVSPAFLFPVFKKGPQSLWKGDTSSACPVPFPPPPPPHCQPILNTPLDFLHYLAVISTARPPHCPIFNFLSVKSWTPLP